MSSSAARWAVQGGLLLLSTLVALALGEAASRLVVDPVDYLMADPVHDSILGGRLPPHTSGHDAWGFRNREVPERADVVTIGDSQTYGVGASGPDSWPAELGRLLDRRVYNAALGGYSPIQYHELLGRYALRLQPAAVVVGLYFGNDLWEAHRTVYALPHWSPLRQADLPAIAEDAPEPSPDRRFLGSVRNWLAHHSIVYRMATSSVFGAFAQKAELAATGSGQQGTVMFAGHGSIASTAFTPAYRLRTVDLDSASIREGLRLTLDRLDLMARECRDTDVEFLVALIPTKERVYAPWIAADTALAGDRALRALIENEAQVDAQVREFLNEREIRYVELVEPLRAALRRSAIYPPNEDGHPNAQGYAAIAGAVANNLSPLLGDDGSETR